MQNMMQTFGILNGNRQRIQHGRGARGFSTTSKAWVNKYADDHYTRLAQQEGYRSRASYKLMQMNKVCTSSPCAPACSNKGPTPLCSITSF